MDTTHEDLCTFISLNSSLNEERSCTGNKNIYFILNYYFSRGNRGSTVVKVLYYKSEGRWFDSSWCHWILH